jgi:hypothetical protein
MGRKSWFGVRDSEKFRVVFLIALAIRLAFLTTFLALIRVLPYDFSEIGNIAHNLASGRGFSSPFGPGSTPTAWLCPLVPALFAALIKLFGTSAPEMMMVVQTIISALSVAVYSQIAGRITDKQTTRLITAVLCIWPESLIRNNEIWYFVFQELGVAVLVWSALWWADNKNVFRGVVSGAVAGIVALINVTPLLVYFAILSTIRKRTPVIVSLITTAMFIMPWTIRNAIVLGRFVPLRTNIGISLYVGNNPNGSIRTSINDVYPGKPGREMVLYQQLGEVSYDRRAFWNAVRYVLSDPGKTIIRTAERAYVVWCTDIFDQWPWMPGHKWWTGRFYERASTLIVICSALIPLMFLIWYLPNLRNLPYKTMFAAVILLMPLPSYFTFADSDYVYGVRPWLAILAIIAYRNN